MSNANEKVLELSAEWVPDPRAHLVPTPLDDPQKLSEILDDQVVDLTEVAFRARMARAATVALGDHVKMVKLIELLDDWESNG